MILQRRDGEDLVLSRAEAVAEILDQLLAGADAGQFMPFARALREWKSIAEIHSDPALLQRLSGASDELSEAVEVPEPPALRGVEDGTGA